MTAIYAPVHAAPAAASRAHGFVRTVAQRVINMLNVFKSRRDLTLVAGMDDRMLSDIGLTRGDVRDAVSVPIWRDPTAILVTRVHERHRSRFFAESPTGRVQAPSLVPHGFGETVEWPVHARRY